MSTYYFYDNKIAFLEKVSFHSNSKKGSAKERSNYRTTASISHVSKVMLKVLQARLPQYVNQELPDIQDGFSKSRGTREQIATIHWIIEKAREFQKNIYFSFIDYLKAFDCVDHKKLENSSRDGNTRPHYLSPEKSARGSRSNSQNRTWNNRLVQNWERNMTRLYIVFLFLQLMYRVHHVKCQAG